MEESILNAVKSLLLGRVNELLGEAVFLIPPIEFTHRPGESYYSVSPELGIASGERSEKDRILLLDVYGVTISFLCNGERDCYVYAATVDQALREDPSLGGTVDYALLVKKEYRAPKLRGAGDRWEVVLTLRISVEDFV
jgi:hypothetical protein